MEVVGRAWICQLYELECCLGSLTLKWPVGSVFIATDQIVAVGKAAGDGRTRQCPVRQPRHPTVRVLTVSTVGALTSWGHRTCTVHCPVRLLALLWLYANCPRTVHVAGDNWSRPLRLLAIALLAHWIVQWIIAERLFRNPKVASLKSYGPGHRTLSGGTPDSPVLQTRVLFGFFCSFLLNPNFDLFIGLCWTFSTCRIYNLEQTS
jgi:hypothetical protein